VRQERLWSEAERHALLCEWSGAGVPALESSECLHERFARVAAATPDALAVSYEDQRLSYGALETWSNRLAWRLRRLGVEPGDRVGLCLERSVEMVVALLATLKAGAAYVPLDPEFPAQRLDYMLEDSGASVLVTAAALAARLHAGPRPSLVLDEDWAGMSLEPATAPAGLSEPRLPAYIIYTSGSTGRPKGVIVGHASVVALFAATGNAFGFGPRDVWTFFHPYVFDFSVWEIWGALLHGGRLVVVPYEVRRTPRELNELLRREEISILSLTPSLFHALVQTELADTPATHGLRLLAFGGEALVPTAVLPWMERYGDELPVLVNLYGPTEVTVHATRHARDGADRGGPGLCPPLLCPPGCGFRANPATDSDAKAATLPT
jgi:amino acid adenylation domain-containing protein